MISSFRFPVIFPWFLSISIFHRPSKGLPVPSLLCGAFVFPGLSAKTRPDAVCRSAPKARFIRL
ncbi:hypothetical protein DWY99_06255 [[Clostridium] leptum]|uniref:Uncharacterized protein n=1 Tax=[Clostridium] leptum TaxID=1535 RepID=A0A412AXM3_9FIRM|nr:hypothetical protein DWY99_06255 [[Clostridium] leptum]